MRHPWHPDADHRKPRLHRLRTSLSTYGNPSVSIGLGTHLCTGWRPDVEHFLGRPNFEFVLALDPKSGRRRDTDIVVMLEALFRLAAAVELHLRDQRQTHESFKPRGDGDQIQRTNLSTSSASS
jgi:hypothetical protein